MKIEKLENSILYSTTYGGDNVGRKKLAKLLYFADFLSYEIRKKSITGVDYVKESYGPMPDTKVFYPILRKMEKNKDIETEEIGELKKIIPNKSPKMKVFDDIDKDILRQMAEKYRLSSGGELEDIAKSEPPYIMTNYKKRIPYHLTFYRNNFGEMDLDEL